MAWRVEQLNAIRTVLEESRDAMREALWHDLRRNRTDADLMDIDMNVREVDHALEHLDDCMKIKREPTPAVMQPAHVRVRREPLGGTLIIDAWNEPQQWSRTAPARSKRERRRVLVSPEWGSEVRGDAWHFTKRTRPDIDESS